MKNLKLKDIRFNAAALTREQMKDVMGGGTNASLPYCTSCCPTKPCKPYPHRYCSDIACT